MPKLFMIYGYIVYFWSNENGEPIHVHIAKGRATGNATKVWLTHSGSILIANNNSKIPKHDLLKICNQIENNSELIVAKWVLSFNTMKFYV